MSQPYPGYEPPQHQQPTVPPNAFPGATQYDPAAPTPNYGVPTPYGFDARPEHPDATLVLVLGVLALFTVVTAPFAWYYGSRARGHMAASPGRWSPSTSLTVGWVLGIVVTLGVVAGFLLIVLGISAFVALG